MCLLRDAELYCVSTKILRMSELMQFETGMSMSRYLPPSGTAGFERSSVSGDKRVPAPPPRITARMFGLFGAMAHTFPVYLENFCSEHRPEAPRVSSSRGAFKVLLLLQKNVRPPPYGRHQFEISTS